MFLKILLLLSVFLGSCQAAWNVTCDFDLERIEQIVEYLPTECQDIYKAGSQSKLYKASLEESKKFVQFYKKLQDHERKESATPANEIPKPNTTFRFDIYNVTSLRNCSVEIENRTDLATDSDKTNEYYKCLIMKREKMMQLIP